MQSPIRQNNERSYRRSVRTILVVMMGVAVLVVMNALAVRPAARQTQPGDALIVDASGRVGIGKEPDSYALLDVSGMIKSQEFLLGDPNKKPGQQSTDQIKITAGYTAFAKGNNNAEISNDISGYKALMLVGNSSRGIGGPRVVQAWDNLEVAKQLSVGTEANIGTATIDKDLTVRGTINGNVKGTINEESPPYTFELGAKGDTTNNHVHQVDGETIKKYLGDEDGGTIKILVRLNNQDDEVRVITETIYIEQPDKSSNKRPGLYGWTQQLDGNTRTFNLGTTEKYDIIPFPWNSVYVKNHSTGGLPGLPPKDGEAWRQGDRPSNEYRLEFRTVPSVSATIIIYDR